MTSPQKHQILDVSRLYATVSHFFHYTPSPLCHQTNSEKLFLVQGPKTIILHDLYN